MAQVTKILVPVDFSEQSEEALAYALRFAADVGASLHVLHVYDLPVYAMVDGVMLPSAEGLADLMTDAQQKLQALLDRLKEQSPQIETRGSTISGSAPVEIVRQAQEVKADLICMATHGRTGTMHILLGSVAERVVRTSPIPVLTVRVAK